MKEIRPDIMLVHTTKWVTQQTGSHIISVVILTLRDILSISMNDLLLWSVSFADDVSLK